jgi:hypothetical protein
MKKTEIIGRRYNELVDHGLKGPELYKKLREELGPDISQSTARVYGSALRRKEGKSHGISRTLQIRIPRIMCDYLEKDARKNGLPLDLFVSTILMDYVFRDQTKGRLFEDNFYRPKTEDQWSDDDPT